MPSLSVSKSKPQATEIFISDQVLPTTNLKVIDDSLDVVIFQSSTSLLSIAFGVKLTIPLALELMVKLELGSCKVKVAPVEFNSHLSPLSKFTALLMPACLILKITGELKVSVAVVLLLRAKLPALSDPAILAPLLTCVTVRPPPKLITWEVVPIVAKLKLERQTSVSLVSSIPSLSSSTSSTSGTPSKSESKHPLIVAFIALE